MKIFKKCAICKKYLFFKKYDTFTMKTSDGPIDFYIHNPQCWGVDEDDKN